MTLSPAPAVVLGTSDQQEAGDGRVPVGELRRALEGPPLALVVLPRHRSRSSGVDRGGYVLTWRENDSGA